MKELEVRIETMSSSQLSEVLGHRYELKEINRKIRDMFEAEIVGGDLPPPLLNERNYVKEYYLPQVESIMFVAKLDTEYLRKLATYWSNRHTDEQLAVTERISLSERQHASETMTLRNKNNQLVRAYETLMKNIEYIARRYIKYVLESDANRDYLILTLTNLAYDNTAMPDMELTTDAAYAFMDNARNIAEYNTVSTKAMRDEAIEFILTHKLISVSELRDMATDSHLEFSTKDRITELKIKVDKQRALQNKPT